MAVVELRGLTKHYGAVHAVDGIDLDIAEGEVFGLLGPNGAGKTTTLSILATLNKPTGGSARVAGHDVAKEPLAVRKQVGIVFQEPSLDTILTGRENLALHAMLYGVPNVQRKPRIAELLKLVDLEHRADSLVKTYSGGMKRRLEIARGLFHRPRVLFLDEPTLGLDPQTRDHIWAYIEKMVAEEKTTVILTTHYMDEADRLCDRVGIIDHGKIVALDTPEGLKQGLGGDLVLLKTASNDLAPFQRLPFVERAEVQGNEIRLTVRNAAAHVPAIVNAAKDLQRVEVRVPTLNDVFLRHTGREMRDEQVDESGGGWITSYSESQRGH